MVKDSCLPKILIVSRLNWDDDSNSNTLTNLFDGYDPEKIARIYIETASPNTKCCHLFYQISEVSLIRRLFRWNTKTGHVIKTESGVKKENGINKRDENKEKALMGFVRKHRSLLFTIMRDALWRLGGWKTKELEQFVKVFNPDVVWLDGSPLLLMNRLNNYVGKIAGKPICTFLMDDVYTYKSCTGLSHKIYRYFLRKQVKKTVESASHVFVSSEKMKQEYDEIFAINNSTFLAKGVSEFVNYELLPEIHKPIRLVYLGNVLIGRFDSLVLLAEAIHRINTEKGKKFELSVYTGDYISDKQKHKFLTDDAIHICKPVSYNEVKRVISENDMVVFVEALEGKQNRIARLSFSTKIVDYIVGGKCILTIGPADSAPVEYLKNHGLSVTACSKDEIYSALNSITPELMREYVLRTADFAQKNHNKEIIQTNLYDIINQVANKQ